MLDKYHGIMDTLVARFAGANSITVIQPFSLSQICMVNHVLLRNHGDSMYYYTQPGNEPTELLPGEFLLIPSRQTISLICGRLDTLPISGDLLMANYTNYFTSIAMAPHRTASYMGFSYINFDVQVLGCISLFDVLDFPAFSITSSNNFSGLFEDILLEHTIERLVKVNALSHATNLLAITIIRYIFDHKLFTDRLIAKLKYLQDKRILDILSYINKNLGKDLYNKVLADVAHISEDYMGQYFKLAMNERPQTYVEHQRMKRALHLLQTTENSIDSISKAIGIKDTAYFCRRFKSLFGIQASKARNRNFIFRC